MTTALVVVAFVAAYVLIATERIHRTAAALVGAAAMVLLGAANAETAFFSEETGVDWNVIFLLLGMMVIVSIVRRTGVFEYLAIWSAKKARGRPFVLMVMLVVLTAVASALLDNVTTVLLVAPVTMLVCERLDVPAAPYLIAEVMASNIGGTATLIGDPPNIIIASRADLSFNDFLVNLAPIVVVLMVVFIGLSWLLWGRFLPTHPERVEAVLRLDEKEAIRDHRLAGEEPRGPGRRADRVRPALRAARRACDRRPARGRGCSWRGHAWTRRSTSKRSSGRPWSSSWGSS